MKVEVKDTTKKEVRTYPYIGKLKESPLLLVLFIEPNIGVSLKDELNNVSHYSDKWDENNFYYFKGEITLKND